MRKRFWILAAALAVSGAVLTPAPAAADPPWGHGRDRDWDPYGDRWDDDWDDDWEDQDSYRRGYEDGQRAARDRGRHDRWSNEDSYYYDPRAHNGYYWRDTWYWGPPPRARYQDCRPGYRRLQRGHRLPHGYVVVPVDDWRAYDLYAPPRGHYWARDERGEYFLLGLAAGVIVDQVLRGW